MMCVGCPRIYAYSLPFCQASITVLECIIITHPQPDFPQASFHRGPTLMGCITLLELRLPITWDMIAPHPLLQAGGSTLHWSHLGPSACSAPHPPQALVRLVCSAAWALGVLSPPR